jgi:hypothetical protein
MHGCDAWHLSSWLMMSPVIPPRVARRTGDYLQGTTTACRNAHTFSCKVLVFVV